MHPAPFTSAGELSETQMPKMKCVSMERCSRKTATSAIAVKMDNHMLALKWHAHLNNLNHFQKKICLVKSVSLENLSRKTATHAYAQMMGHQHAAPWWHVFHPHIKKKEQHMNKSANLVKFSWMIVAHVIAHKMVSQQNALWWHALGNVITQREIIKGKSASLERCSRRTAICVAAVMMDTILHVPNFGAHLNRYLFKVMKTLRHVSLARLSRETATFANAQKMGCQQYVPWRAVSHGNGFKSEHHSQYMKAVLQGVAGNMIAILVTVAMMVIMLSAPSNPVKRKRIQRTLLSDRNGYSCSDISKTRHSLYLFIDTDSIVT